MKFSKMNGIGNDYIYVNLMNEDIQNPNELSIRLSDRNFGIGADGLVLIDRSDVADFSMRMFNPDGSEGEMCGNAIRCVGKYVFDKGLTKKRSITVETLAGIKALELFIERNKVESVKVNMGKAFMDKALIPVIHTEKEVINVPINTRKGQIRISCVSMGNPHTIIFIDDESDIDMQLGEEISNNRKMFPNKTNVEFVRVIDKENVFVRVYERGTGETLACGTGACASFYICNKLNKTGKKANIHLRGGSLFVEMIGDNIFMTGKAQLNYEGELDL